MHAGRRFLEGRSGLYIVLACVLSATTKKGRQLFAFATPPLKYFSLEPPLVGVMAPHIREMLSVFLAYDL